MSDEVMELLDAAIYKEISAEALYIAGQNKTEDPAAKLLMKELAAEEHGHAERLKKLKEKGFNREDWHRERVPNLMISDYLTGAGTLEGAGFQDTLIFAMKREQQSVEFYAKMTAVMREENAKRLCESLVHEELRHKLRLETLYDDLFYAQD